MPVETLDTSEVTWIDDPRLADYRGVRDPELVRRSNRFIAEGRQLVRTLLFDSPFVVRSVLIDDTAWATLGDELGRLSGVVIYRVPAGQLEDVAGWKFHQGCLAVGERPAVQSVASLLDATNDPDLVVGLDAVSNPDNVGAIFRSGAALGAGALILGPTSVSPLYRKAARSSMGAALCLPFSHGPAWREGLLTLKARGYVLWALTPGESAVSLEAAAEEAAGGGRHALLLGAEGLGLSATSLELCDQRVVIPMHAGINSLNVAASAAIALYRLSQVIRGR